MKKSIVLFVLLFFLIPASLFAKMSGPSAYGPESKRFGAGLYLGEPIGITIKGYLTERWSLQGIAAWSFVEDSVTLIGSGLYDFFDIPVDSGAITLPFYAGFGAKVGFDRGGNDKNRTLVSLNVPVGLAVQWTNYPVELSFEIAPGVQIVPSTDFDLYGGLGARFYF